MTDAWSISDGYWDTDGTWHPTTDETRAALRAAMGAHEIDDDAPPEGPPMWFVETDAPVPLAGRCDVVLEDGTRLAGLDELPPDLPPGYHRLEPHDGGHVTRLVMTPRRCRLPSRQWGWAVQLYTLRSGSSWGVGDLGDLRRLCEWSARLGAGVVQINPLHAAAPLPPLNPSPYSPTSRLWRNVVYLRVAELPGAGDLDGDLGRLDAAGRALNGSDRIDRDAAVRLKLDALEQLFARFDAGAGDHDRFADWVAAQGEHLDRFAVWCALAERFGPAYPAWPRAYRHPESAAVAAFATAHADRVRFHQWCQWHLDGQLATAGRAGVELVSDVAVGFDPAGADAWAFQDLLAAGCRVGAPPDTFNPSGQDWGLPPFVPWKLRAAAYDPFVGHGAGRPRPLRRHPHRPRHGPVPPVLDPARRRVGRRRVRALPRPASCSTCWRSRRAGRGLRRRRGPRHGRGRGAERARGPRHAVATACCGSRTSRRPTYPVQALPRVTTHDLPTHRRRVDRHRPRRPAAPGPRRRGSATTTSSRPASSR